MCTNRRKVVNPYTGQSLVVDCGKCPSCLQAKANKRARRLLAEYNEVLDDRTFVTLTYKNEFIPYVKDNDVQSFFDSIKNKRKNKDAEHRYSLPLYRDYDCRLVFDPIRKVYHEKKIKLTKPLKYYHDDDFATSNFEPDNIKSTWYNFVRSSGNRFESQEYGKIGVCYFRDLQNFMKRLRINLKRMGYNDKIRFYACSEYGPTTCRPHLHLLLLHPKGDHTLVKSAVIKSWLYDDIQRRFENVEPAFSPSHYLASYVNCDKSVKGLLHDCKPFKMRHSYSQGFGINKDIFSLASLAQMYRIGNFGITQRIVRDGVPTDIIIPVPKYVVSRYFPKFKGFGKLTPYEVYSLIQKPADVSKFSHRLNADSKQLRGIFVKLCNLKEKYGSFPAYAELYANIWNSRTSYMLKNFHDTIYKDDPLEAYDNIVDFYSGEISSDFVCWDNREHNETDYNKFKRVVSDTSRLTETYYRRSKDKKVKNLAYSQHQNV